MDVVTLTLRISAKDRDMIKKDAKALNMNPSGYVTMVCRSLNDEARSDGMQDLTHQVIEAAMKQLNTAKA